MERRYRTRKETIDYFVFLADGFANDAYKALKENGPHGRDYWYNYAKADAYRMAAFELEHNMEG